MNPIRSNNRNTTRTHLGCFAVRPFHALSGWYADMLEQPSTPDPGQEAAL